jgi:hypothetical protein
MGNYYYLPDLTEAHLDRLVERFPAEYWFDGQALAEL